MKIAAVIVTHKRLEVLKVTLARTLAEPFARVIVVDTASRDGTADWLRQHPDPRVEPIILDRNVGGAGGFAAGLRHLLSTGEPMQWAVLFDDDAFPETGALGAFEMALASIPQDSLGAVAALVTRYDGTPSTYNLPTRVPFRTARDSWLWLTGRFARRPDTQGRMPEPVDTASFVGFFVRPDVLRLHGLPDERLFISGDDTAFALHLRRSGLVNWFVPAVRFVHDARSPQENGHAPWRAFYIARNRVLLILDHMPKWLAPILILRMYLRLSRQSDALPKGTRHVIMSQARCGILAGVRSFGAYRNGSPLFDLQNNKGPS